MTSFQSEGGNSHKNNARPQVWWFIVAGAVLMMLVALLWPRPRKVSGNADSLNAATVGGGSGAVAEQPRAVRRFGVRSREPGKSAEQIVAEKVRLFGQKRRAIAERIAHRLNKDLPPEIAAFFDAIDKGDWDEIHTRWMALKPHIQQYAGSKNDRPDLEPYWASVMDAYGVAEQAHNWPAQKLLDYGNTILDSLRPGMVYVGGTDDGRWIPELLNETSGGDPHIIITQNALADSTYLDYVRELYGDQFKTFSQEDSQRAFQEYSADAQKRLQHDLDFPDEPKQVLPGENITMVDGHAQVSGATAVMGINEKLLQILMAQNPELSFGMQESFPLKGTYADALPLGPLMELNAQGGQGSFTADRAADSVDYWRSAAQALMADPEASGSTYALKAYSHDINATANLLAANNFPSQAEDAYKLASQVSPDNAEPVEGLAQVLVQTGHADQARVLLDNFASKYPEQRPAIEKAKAGML